MARVSVTRLRLRSRFFLVPFGWSTYWIERQLKRSAGFIEGMTAYEPGLALWTVTLWKDSESMKAFRVSGAHLKALKGVLNWCDEASYGHWEQDSEVLPDIADAHRKIVEVGRVSKVKRPTPEHQAGRLATDVVPKRSQRLRPIAVKA